MSIIYPQRRISYQCFLAHLQGVADQRPFCNFAVLQPRRNTGLSNPMVFLRRTQRKGGEQISYLLPQIPVAVSVGLIVRHGDTYCRCRYLIDYIGHSNGDGINRTFTVSVSFREQQDVMGIHILPFRLRVGLVARDR